MNLCGWYSILVFGLRQFAAAAALVSLYCRKYRFSDSVSVFQSLYFLNTGLNRQQIDTILSALAYHAAEVPIYYRLRPNLKDPNDDMVFECAANFDADAIITHNIQDFKSPELIYRFDVLTPGEFLQRIKEDA